MRNQKNIFAFILLSLFIFPVVAFGAWDVSELAQFNLPNASIYEIIYVIFEWILGIFSFIAIIGFIISGLIYLTAAGDEDRMETAKNAMYYSIIGTIVGISGYVALMAVENLLNATGNI